MLRATNPCFILIYFIKQLRTKSLLARAIAWPYVQGYKIQNTVRNREPKDVKHDFMLAITICNTQTTIPYLECRNKMQHTPKTLYFGHSKNLTSHMFPSRVPTSLHHRLLAHSTVCWWAHSFSLRVATWGAMILKNVEIEWTINSIHMINIS